MIVSCMVLHNILIDLKDETALDSSMEVLDLDLEAEIRQVPSDCEEDEGHDDFERQMGKRRRDMFKDFFYKRATQLKRKHHCMLY